MWCLLALLNSKLLNRVDVEFYLVRFQAKLISKFEVIY